MYKAADIADILIHHASAFPDKAAFADGEGGSFSFAELLAHSRFVASELSLLGLNGRSAAVLGEISYSGAAAMFGCALASVPFVIADPSLSDDELEGLLKSCDAGVLFCTDRYRERAGAVCSRLRSVLPVPEFEALFALPEAGAAVSGPNVDACEPALLLLTGEKKPTVLTHKNICSTLASVAEALDISSYTFLGPAVWGGAFDCVMGLLLPLYAGCTVIRRGAKRSVAKAIAESGATALTCTPERLVNLEKSLRSRSIKTMGKGRALLHELLGAALSAVGIDAGKRTFKKIHSLMGHNLKLIICGGAYPDKDCIRHFSTWGFDIYNCYFLAECGAAALSAVPGGRPVPLMEAHLAPAGGEREEILLSGPSLAESYFGGKDIPSPFPTGDLGRLCEDGSLEIFGKRRTVLLSGEGAPIFPEELASVLCRSRYISRCSVSGRFDTGTAGILVSAVITPDYRAVATALGNKYSLNRLRILIAREIEKLTPQLPHKINDFKLIEKKSEKGT